MIEKRNVYLIGFMGTGKSAVGRATSDRLNLQFLDMDDLIVHRAGKPIPRIFAEDGEPAFRALERQVAQDLSSKHGLIVATGGGVVLNPDNMQDFYSSGLVVCLSARPEIILQRVEGDTNRPLLSGSQSDKMSQMSRLMEQRQTLYDSVPDQIDTSDLTLDEVVEQLVLLYGESSNG
ncbi:MAG: shikimate kinase [Kiritimatiellae bacterium]|nr:shikimate kinase [Kiritimatiellia bacterium]